MGDETYKPLCRSEWIEHFHDFSDNATLVQKLMTTPKPNGTAWTSHALSLVKTELMFGRQNTPIVVIVLTAGKPLHHGQLGDAALQLRRRKFVHLAWVLIGGTPATSDMTQWYDQSYDTFYQLPPQESPVCKMNQIMTDTCYAYGR